MADTGVGLATDRQIGIQMQENGTDWVHIRGYEQRSERKVYLKDSSDHIIKRVKKPYIENQRNQSCLTPWRWKTTQGTSLN